MIRQLARRLLPALAAGSVAFAYVEVGAVLPNFQLAGTDGAKRALLRDDAATLFVFFDPQQPFSHQTLVDLAQLRQEFAGRQIDWVGLASPRFAPEAVRQALADAGLQLTLLVDEGDKVYGELGVRLYPSIGIADAKRVLRAYLPYSKVDYTSKVRAHLRHTLGEIDDAALEAALAPGAIEINQNGARAERHIKMAHMLAASGKLEMAIDSARQAVAAAPDKSATHAVLGALLATKGDCAAARPVLERALQLEAGNAEAAEALRRCP
jgi:peroxiredoxin